jgi:Ni,Fe-hydrogenase III small subunit/formate hydrogenlyase subunit 6/NADH:ubiquinone oxidoreductase subunit I
MSEDPRPRSGFAGFPAAPDPRPWGVFGPSATGPYPARRETPSVGGRRTPVHVASRCELGGACEAACPTGAIQIDRGRPRGSYHLDYGRCIFCRACVDACPTGALRAVPAFELACRSRGDLRSTHEVGAGAPPAERLTELEVETRDRVRRLFGRSVAIRVVDAGSCNGCEVEVGALTWPRYDLERLGFQLVASPRHADLLLVTGPVTRNMREALEKTFRAMPSPKMVLAIGACGISGGPFAASPECCGGVASTVPVDVWVPGCPPRPEALLFGILLALGRVEQRMRDGELVSEGRGAGPSGKPPE